ncbi:MAG TPA: HK97 family phage prohead protease [Allosphingosinicella sp.]|nr:HK97 family phage prohead protease [Allosphingosinicella sp.]
MQRCGRRGEERAGPLAHRLLPASFSSPRLRVKTSDLEMGMRFAGYAAIFGRPDRGGDVVRAGAFAASLKRGGGTVPLLWQHRPDRPIGRIEYLREDRRGLRVIGRLVDGRAARLLTEGAISGLSFGYRVKAATEGSPRELSELELVEISLVTMPMQPRARVHAIEEAAKAGP